MELWVIARYCVSIVFPLPAPVMLEVCWITFIDLLSLCIGLLCRSACCERDNSNPFFVYVMRLRYLPTSQDIPWIWAVTVIVCIYLFIFITDWIKGLYRHGVWWCPLTVTLTPNSSFEVMKNWTFMQHKFAARAGGCYTDAWPSENWKAVWRYCVTVYCT